jgi:hypothetical protein
VTWEPPPLLAGGAEERGDSMGGERLKRADAEVRYGLAALGGLRWGTWGVLGFS